MEKLHFIDTFIIISYLIFCLLIGFYKSKSINNITEYAVGDKSFSTFAIISTIFATYISANQVIGNTEQLYKVGLIYAIAILFTPLSWVIVKYIYAKNIDNFRGCLSISEVMCQLYGQPARYITGIVAIIHSTGFIAMQVIVIGYLFKFLFNLEYVYGVFIGIGILTFYSAFGGIRAVIFTDVFQFLVFFLVLPVAAGMIYYKAGGYEQIIDYLPQSHLTIYENKHPFAMLFGYLFFVLLPIVHAPYIQRLLMAKHKKQLLRSYNVIILASLIFVSVLLVISFSIRSINYNSEVSFSFYEVISYLPPGMTGLMAAAMLAVVMSSADSWLNTLSVIVSHDIVKQTLPHISNKKEVLIARITTFVCSVFAIIIALSIKEVFNLLILVSNFYFPIMLVPITAGFLNFKSNLISLIFSIIAGVISTLLARFMVGEFGVITVLVGVLSSCAFFFGAHYIQVALGRVESIKITKKFNFKFKALILLRFIPSYKKQNLNDKSLYYILSIILLLLNVPLIVTGYYPFETLASSLPLYIRYITTFLALLLLFHELFKIKKTEFLYYITLWISISFLSPYKVFISELNAMWCVYGIISFILLALFTDIYRFFYLGITGIIFAFITYKFLTYDIYFYALLNPKINMPIYTTYSCIVCILALAYMLYRAKHIEDIKKKGLVTLGRSIAHNITSPISANLMELELIEGALNEKDYESVFKYVKELKESNMTALQDIRIMLNSMANSEDAKTHDWGQYSVSRCVKNALKSFYMSEEQESRVTFIDTKQDFIFNGSATMFKHIIFNLLKNALKYAGDEANISIYIKNKELFFKDDGYGISDKVLDRIFEKYLTTGAGHGIGLSFCKEAMNKMNGDIICNSKLGQGTEFILMFN